MRRDFHSVIAVFVLGFIGGMILFTIASFIADMPFWIESLVLSTILGLLFAGLVAFRLHYQRSYVTPKS